MKNMYKLILAISFVLISSPSASADIFHVVNNYDPGKSIWAYSSTFATIDMGIDDRTVTDVNIFLDISHDYLDDLDVIITHAGETIELFDDIGGKKNDISNVWFDDEASADIDASGRGNNPHFGPGIYRPEASYYWKLSAFDGMALGGLWTLEVYDDNDHRCFRDEGALNSFGIAGTLEETNSPVPEPATMLLLGTGLAGLVGFRKKFRN